MGLGLGVRGSKGRAFWNWQSESAFRYSRVKSGGGTYLVRVRVRVRTRARARARTRAGTRASVRVRVRVKVEWRVVRGRT